jgi:four helix bundle protein
MMGELLKIEDLIVNQKLCQLHIEVCELTKKWPAEEKFEFGSQIRCSSNCSPANLAEKHLDRHIKNKIEGVNRSRGEAVETIHHLYIATLKKYIDGNQYDSFRSRYLECIRMLNGMERTFERQLDQSLRRWPDNCKSQAPSPEP